MILTVLLTCNFFFSGMTRRNINDLDTAQIRYILNFTLIKLHIACNIPFSVVQSPYYQEFVQTFLSVDPKKIIYKVPCRQTMASTLLIELHKTLEVKKKKLLQYTESIALIDGWKKKAANQKLLVTTLRNEFVDNIYLTSADMSLEREFGTVLGEHINNAVKLAHDQYDSNVIGVITDNDTKIKAGARRGNNGEILEPLLVSTCYSHSGNLLLKDIVDKDFAEKLRVIVAAFKEPKTETLVKMQFGTKLQNFPDTRFCYPRKTCDTIIDNLEVLRFVHLQIPGSDILKEAADLICSDEFESELLATFLLIDPICRLIDTCQNAKINVADGTELWLTLKLPDDSFEDVINKRIASAVHDVGYAANLMNPKYQGRNLNATQKKVAITFIKNYLGETAEQELQDFMEARADSDPLEGWNDPFVYWKMYKFLYPKLSQLCLRMLLMPASTASIESFFSYWTHVHTDSRNRLSTETSAILSDSYHMSKHLDKNMKWKNTLKTNKKRRRNQ